MKEAISRYALFFFTVGDRRGDPTKDFSPPRPLFQTKEFVRARSLLFFDLPPPFFFFRELGRLMPIIADTSFFLSLPSWHF